MRRIYLDMDGTIANLYKGEWLKELRAYSTKPYEVADRLVDENILLELIANGYELGIISWTSRCENKEYDKMVRIAKRNWLKENYPNVKFAEIHIVKYGTPKHYVAKIKNQILVDDEKPNRDNWKGYAIHPSDLEKLL